MKNLERTPLARKFEPITYYVFYIIEIWRWICMDDGLDLKQAGVVRVSCRHAITFSFIFTVDFSGQSPEISFGTTFWLSNLSRMSCSIKRSSSTKLSKVLRFNAPALTSKVFLGHIKYTYVSHKVKNEIQIINERHL